MNCDTNNANLPSITEDILTGSNILVDNLFADVWKKCRMQTLLNRAGFNKRSGTPASEVVFILLLWVWLKMNSIGMFSRESILTFSQARKDVMYDFLKREDLNWRTLHAQTAKQIYNQHQLDKSKFRALVLDDSVKQRRGKHMEGVSRHFDHLTKRTVMGHQVLTLGYATEAVFLPLDSDIYISQKDAQGLKKPFKDGRSVAAKRYSAAKKMTKPEQARGMVKRASKLGFEADYLLADAWFGNKTTIRLAYSECLTAILRMKKDKTYYRITEYHRGKTVTKQMNAQELYKQSVRNNWQKLDGIPIQAIPLDVELNLAESDNKPEQWVKVRLLFVRGTASTEKSKVGKHDWALFLSMDTTLTPQQILEIYGLRWGIEVYFKEAKQHLGLLKEQTKSFASHIASIHLTAIRFCMLVYEKLNQAESRVCDIRHILAKQLNTLDNAKQLWNLFKNLIVGALNDLEEQLGGIKDEVLKIIETRIHGFFLQVLQLNTLT